MSDELVSIAKKTVISIESINFLTEALTIILTDKHINILSYLREYKNDLTLNKMLNNLNLEENGRNAFSVAALRKKTSSVINSQHDHEAFKPYTTLATPIFNCSDEIVGYLGMVIINNKYIEAINCVIEIMSKLITLELKQDNSKKLKWALEDIFEIKELTSKEVKIIQCISQGMKDEEISRILYISVSTVRAYINKMFTKFDINSRAQLIDKYYKIKIEFILRNL